MTAKRYLHEVATRPHLPDDEAIEVRKRLVAYLASLGLSDAGFRETLVEESMLRARRRVAPGCGEELLRRSLEEVQRRLDGGVARLLSLAGARNAHEIAAGRAALLLDARLRSHLEQLFHGGEHEAELHAQVSSVLPRATPQEAPLGMRDQEISFLFSPRPAKKP